MTITATDVDLLSFDDVIKSLEVDQPDSAITFTTDAECPVTINVPQGWNAGVAEMAGPDLLPSVVMGLGDKEYGMTKDALLDLTSTMSIQREYMMRTPGALMQPHVAYWLKTTERQYRFLVKDDVVVAMARKPTVVPFTNTDILVKIGERMVEAKLVDEVADIKVDYKIHHDLKYTGIRLIVPTPHTTIESLRNGQNDVADTWSIGVQMLNSLTGYFPLSISGYLFSWFCTNGATATHLDIAKYNRRTHGQDMDTVGEWEDTTVDQLLDDLPMEIGAVGKLTEIELASEMSSTLRDVFERLKVPMPARAPIIDNVVDSADSSAYGLMQAITQAANSPEFTDEIKTRIFHVGGDMPALLGDRCEACHRLPV